MSLTRIPFRNSSTRSSDSSVPIDVLINNAGIMPVGRIIDEPDAVTRRILDINVYGVILGSKLAVQRMVPRGKGHVINVASLAGEIYAVGLATYCASKHAVVGFTDSARIEYRSAGVKFSMVLPTIRQHRTHGRDLRDEGIQERRARRDRRRDRRTGGPAQAAGANHQGGRRHGRVAEVLAARLAEALNRRLGGDHVFTDDVDVDKRKAYEARARGEE